MATSPVQGLAGAPATRSAGVVRGVLRVVAFWWLATGVTFAAQRNGSTRVLSLLISTALLAVAARLVFRSRNERTAHGAEAAFLGAALTWLWVATTFYGGWVIGLELPTLPTAGPGLDTALLALRATAYHEMMGVACIAVAVAVSGRNPVAWQTLATFWGTDQLARLNIFFGVANPGLHFLPPHLAFLGAFFGPARNSALLLPSVLLLMALAAWALRRARRGADEFERAAGVLMGVLLVLAVVEHVVLGIRADLPLWEPFLRARGTS